MTVLSRLPITGWLTPALVGMAGLCVVVALILGDDAALYVIGAAVAAAIAGLVVAYLGRERP